MRASDLSVADDVRALVIRMLPPLGAGAIVDSESDLTEDGLGFDSVGLIELLCACESHFGVPLPAEILLGQEDAALTVGQLIAHIEQRVEGSIART